MSVNPPCCEQADAAGRRDPTKLHVPPDPLAPLFVDAQLTLCVETRPGSVLVVQARGTADLASLCDGVDRVAGVARAQGSRRVLLDLRTLQQSLRFSEHLQLGMHVAEGLRFVERVASVVPDRYRTGASEKAAQHTGLALRTFIDFGEALAWIEQ